MSLKASTVVSAPPLGPVKMEDRKRAIVSDHHDDISPPAKRIATDLKPTMSEPAADPIKFGTEGTPWQVELETFQKDALLRQMREYKREKSLLEAQLADLQKRARSHDEILRFVEAYIDQFLDEVRVLTGKIDAVGTKPGESIVSALITPTSPLTTDDDVFSSLLATRIPKIKSAMEECLSKFPPLPADIRLLQQKLNETLATLKSERKLLEHLKKESSDHKTAWEAATERYMKAEKRLDRLKSTALINLEKQGRVPSSTGGEGEQVNGDNGSSAPSVDSGAVRELEIAHKKAVLEAGQAKEQLEKMEEEKRKLTAEITAVTTRLTCLSDEDFAKTDLFKASKAQQEDLIKRINQLEGTHIQLREEAKKLQAERMEYRRRVDEETRKSVEEAEQQMGKVDADLQRIRQERDALQDKLNIVKAARPEHRATLEKVENASKAKDARIAALEEQVERLKVAAKEVKVQPTQDLDDLSGEELKMKAATLQKELDGLKAEVPQMEAAYTKYHSLAMKKVNEFRSFEERIAQLNAEKAKADQKFYTAMKEKEAVDAKNRVLNVQNSKTSALISAFKETDAKLYETIRNLEKQIAEHQTVVTEITTQHQVSLQQTHQAETMSKHIMMNVVDLKKKLAEKDDTLAVAQKAQRKAEVEAEKLKVDLDSTKKDAEEWRAKATSNPSAEVDLLRSVAYCTNCSRNMKDTFIKTCSHVFCRECVNERIQSRSRKCPLCMKPFGLNDSMPIHLV